MQSDAIYGDVFICIRLAEGRGCFGNDTQGGNPS